MFPPCRSTGTVRPAFPLFAVVLTLLMPESGTAQRSSADTRRIADAAIAPQGAESLIRAFEWRNIGPANMAGRVTDIAAVEANPAIVYVGAASGGVFKSTNAGTTWEAIFTSYGSGNIGDLAVFQQNPDIVWVGTGESCTRNSVGWGDGVYKSTDGGRTFTNVGLHDTHHISEVLIHPTNPDIVYVAAQGHLWGHTGERGIFKTTDGGRTWRNLTRGLPADGRTGASDLIMDPTNPDILYAGFWERIRMPHRFLSGGPQGGIFKSTDGGESWTKLTSGLPSGPTGKIGLAVFRRDPRVLVAIVEHGFQPDRNSPDYADMSKLGTGIYRSEDGGQSWRYINRFNNRPFYYSHVWIDPNNAQRVFVFSGSAQVSEDGGRTFARSFEGISGDFHALWIDPANSLRMYVGNDKGSYISHDGGHHFVMFDNMDLGQFYAVTADMRDPYWVYGGLQDNGNWGGPSNSRDYNGVLNDHWFKFHSGDGFHTTVDPNDWRIVYTESQGGNIRRLDAVFRQQGESITPSPQNILNLDRVLPSFSGPQNRLPAPAFRFNWSSPLILSPHDSRVVYFGGNYLFQSSDRGETWRIISPDLSNADTAHINPESGGLTRDVTSAETHATTISVSESPLIPGVIWVGTDDGNVQLTRDGGTTWANVRANVPTASPAAARTRTAAAGGVPAGTWVSRVAASHYDAARAYVTFDGHRRDDFRPHVYRTTDWGRTWTNIAGDLPADEPVYVIVEDRRNPDLLFVGTEFGAYMTIDGGTRWHRINRNLPTVSVHDLVIHPRDNDLIAATHGRSIWILDDISPLQQLTREVMASDVFLFRNRVATRWMGVSRGATRGHMLFQGRNPLTIAHEGPANSPSELENAATISFWLKDAPTGNISIEIAPLTGPERFSAQIPATQGVNRYFWNMRFEPTGGRGVAQAGGGRGGGRGGGGGGEGGFPGPRGPQADAGTYRVTLTVNGRAHTGTVTIRNDPEAGALSAGR